MEPKADIAAKVEKIDRQIGELTTQWEQAQDDLDVSRQLARLWEERLDLMKDEQSFSGAHYYYHHVNGIVSGGEPSIVRKLNELAIKQLDLQIQSMELWLAHGGGAHEEAALYGEQIAAAKKAKAEFLAKQEKDPVLFGDKTAKPRAQFW